MEFAVPPLRVPLRRAFRVPPSKSLHQRALALDALAGGGTPIEAPGCSTRPGEDVEQLGAALAALGPWRDGALGTGRTSLRLDLGAGATGFRYCVALATLRQAGARTLVAGRPTLRARPHRPLLSALGRLGGRVKRRHSGSLRVLGGGMGPGRLRIDATTSSQYVTALLLIAPRVGGLELELAPGPSSLSYVALTVDMLRAFGVEVATDGLDAAGGTLSVKAARPVSSGVRLEPDASCASAWWTAAALTGGEVVVDGVRRDCAQADMALLPLLERMGASVDQDAQGHVRVRGGELTGAGEVDLRDCSDLVFLVAALAARARGETIIRGVRHTRRKESDRVAVAAEGLRRLGADVAVDPDDSIRIRGGSLVGAHVSAVGDHRAAFAFGVLGLVVPGTVLRGAEAVAKSHPSFLEDLRAAADEPGNGPPEG